MIFINLIVTIFLFMSLMWLWYRWSNNPSVVDVGWGVCITLSGCLYIYEANQINQRQQLIASLLLLWGLRLSGYLWYTRIRIGELDKRYSQLSASWLINKKLGFFLNFQLQGLFIFLLSLPFYFIAHNTTPLGFLDIIVTIMLLCALILESLADFQLHQFKQAQKYGVCNSGLWRYSRHPNYFFEWVIWLCFAILAINSPLSVLALLSPVTLYLIMHYFTIPMTEKSSLQSKGKLYRDYQHQTPRFFPGQS